LLNAEAALVSAPVSDGLDVERLAAALDSLSSDGIEYELAAPEEREERRNAAETVAAEYARLSSPKGQDR
jgi:hypothetical protein